MSADRVAELLRFCASALRADEAWPQEAAAFAERHGAALGRELLRTLTLFAGFPRCLHALDLAHEALAVGAEPVAAATSEMRKDCSALGAASFARVYGSDAEPVLARLGALDPVLREWVLEHAYGRAYQGTLLGLEERERIAVIALASSACWKQCESHLRACRRLGVTSQQLRADAGASDWLDRTTRARLLARLDEDA